VREDTVAKPRVFPVATPRVVAVPVSETPIALPTLPAAPRMGLLPPYTPTMKAPTAPSGAAPGMPAVSGGGRARSATTVAMEASFYGAAVAVLYDTAALPRLATPLTGKIIGEAWERMSVSDHSALLESAQSQKRELALSDWAYCRLLGRIARELYPAQDARAELLTWFLLLKSGYQAKLGYAEDRAWVLFSSSVVVYNAPSFRAEENGPKYYALTLEGEPARDVTQLYTYAGNYDGATRAIEFRMSEPPRLPSRLVWRTLRFSDGAGMREVRVPLNGNLLDYLERHPRLGQDAYFAGGLTTPAWEAIETALRPVVANRSEVDAVNLVLHFVQNAFEYQTDEDQFKRDKPFFADETLFYKASDCEDRAVLFATLVRRLLGLDVIGLDYPGHVATAVRFRGSVPGAAVMHGGARFVVADPTYINADAGMVMPQYANTAPVAIQVP
jgi:hypothetical protein